MENNEGIKTEIRNMKAEIRKLSLAIEHLTDEVHQLAETTQQGNMYDHPAQDRPRTRRIKLDSLVGFLFLAGIIIAIALMILSKNY